MLKRSNFVENMGALRTFLLDLQDHVKCKKDLLSEILKDSSLKTVFRVFF